MNVINISAHPLSISNLWKLRQQFPNDLVVYDCPTKYRKTESLNAQLRTAVVNGSKDIPLNKDVIIVAPSITNAAACVQHLFPYTNVVCISDIINKEYAA